jgi:hypothetical protein
MPSQRIQREHFMKHFLRLATIAGATVAATLLPSPVSPGVAHAGHLNRHMNGGFYYDGGFAPRHRGYSGYGFSQYGNGGYTYYAPRAYTYPTYRTHGFGFDNGIGIGATFNGVIDRGNFGSRYYGRPYRPAYSPYGYGGYGPYGY